MDTELDITPIVPLGLGELDLDMIDCYVSGDNIAIFEDEELKISNQNSTNPSMAIELNGKDSKISFFTDCNKRYLVFQFKTVNRYMTISITCIDDTGKERMFEMSNKNSVVVIENSQCSMPIEVGHEGWQYTCIEPGELLANAFGTTLQTVKEITVYGSCRVGKIFFQNKKYADVELPSFLRLVNEN